MLKANKPIHVIGAGLAGCEAAYQIIRYGIPVILHEMRPVKSDEAHKTADFAAILCVPIIWKMLSVFLKKRCAALIL